LRSLVGMRNTLVDLLYHKLDYNVMDYANLWFVKANYNKILYEYEKGLPHATKHYFHTLDPWFEKNEKYYYYNVKDFPEIQKIIDQIPCVDKETAKFAVMDAPINIPAHRAESNLTLRYHLTIQSGRDCVLYTEYESHVHQPTEAFLFDHSRYHRVTKSGFKRRVVLILDIFRF